MCTINKSGHTKKSLETYLMILVNLLVILVGAHNVIMREKWFLRSVVLLLNQCGVGNC